MDWTFTDEQEMLREMVRKFVDNELKPRAEEIDREKRIPRELIDKMAELGFLGISFPPEYGGAGMGEMGYCIMQEEIGRGCASTATFIGAHQSIGASGIYMFGTEEQKQKYLVPLAEGRKIAAYALTEPNAGSDAFNSETTAEEKEDHWLLNGRKIFITNGSFADVISLFAKVKGGPADGKSTAFIVEKEFDGFSVGKIEDKMGIRGSETAELILEDVKVPKENVLGRIGRGVMVGMKVLMTGRLGLGAAALGSAKEALRLSSEYAKERKQFGKKISQNQAIQWMLADMATEIYNMESILYRTAWLYDQGKNVTKESSIVKLYCSEALDRIVDRAMQIYGGYGFINDFPIERMYRDSRINRIFEGTNEIQRMILARDVLHDRNL
ncbi:MAG: acyl-CoA dehydrogenase family protein [Candidatus Krumholzibacteriota bacterium]|nr:acyl-CoA dehydrogenase family protein [Candidatus Krumholzibacteriota bacterium]